MIVEETRVFELDDDIAEDIGMALSNNAFGWCNNFQGFIPYRYLIENKIKNENI